MLLCKYPTHPVQPHPFLSNPKPSDSIPFQPIKPTYPTTALNPNPFNLTTHPTPSLPSCATTLEPEQC